MLVAVAVVERLMVLPLHTGLLLVALGVAGVGKTLTVVESCTTSAITDNYKY